LIVGIYALLNSLAQAKVELQDLPNVSGLYLLDLPAQAQVALQPLPNESNLATLGSRNRLTKDGIRV